jgi:hypothetical protein
MFFEELPKIIRFSLIFGNLDRDALYRHIETAEDSDFLRNEIEGLGCVSFIAEGSVLPRASGVDPGPMSADEAVPFESPPSLRMDVELPNRGQITGMGIPKGVTLIVGGSMQNRPSSRPYRRHIQPRTGDGVSSWSNPNAVRIRAEDGRRSERWTYPPSYQTSPTARTRNHSRRRTRAGAPPRRLTSSIPRSRGARAPHRRGHLGYQLHDEDHRMRELVSRTGAYNPFIDMVRSLTRTGLTVLVMGGSGLLRRGGPVICMTDYKSSDVTAEALGMAKRFAAEEKKEGPLGG